MAYLQLSAVDLTLRIWAMGENMYVPAFNRQCLPSLVR